MPPFRRQGGQARVGAVLPQLERRLVHGGSGRHRLPRGGGAGVYRLCQGHRPVAQLMDGGGHLVRLVKRRPAVDIRAAAVAAHRFQLGQRHVHGAPLLMGGHLVGDEPADPPGRGGNSSAHLAVRVAQGTQLLGHQQLGVQRPEGLHDDQRVPLGKGGLLGRRYLLCHGVEHRHQVFVVLQPLVEHPAVVQLLSRDARDVLARADEHRGVGVGDVVHDGGQDIRQVDKGVSVGHPAGRAIPGFHPPAVPLLLEDAEGFPRFQLRRLVRPSRRGCQAQRNRRVPGRPRQRQLELAVRLARQVGVYAQHAGDRVGHRLLGRGGRRRRARRRRGLRAGGRVPVRRRGGRAASQHRDKARRRQ